LVVIWRAEGGRVTEINSYLKVSTKVVLSLLAFLIRIGRGRKGGLYGPEWKWQDAKALGG